MASVPPGDPTNHQDPEADGQRDEASRPWLPVAIWGALMAGLLVVIALVDLTTISYRYNAFSQRTIRQEDARGLIGIWREQVGDLPSDGWLLDAAFVASIVIMLLTVAWGAWLLLVSGTASDDASRSRTRRRGGA